MRDSVWLSFLALAGAFTPASGLGFEEDPPICDPLDGRGSLLVFPLVELKWDAGGTLVQETVLSITNRHVEDVSVQFYFINGDAPAAAVFRNGVQVERAHPGWNWIDCQAYLHGRRTETYAASTGGSIGCQPFRVLDAGNPPGRPDSDVSDGSRVLRGYVLVWAVNAVGAEISWNQLSGIARVTDFSNSRTWTHDAYAFRAVTAPIGVEPDCTPGQLQLDGSEYTAPYRYLLFDFTASGTHSVSGQIRNFDTDLTLLPAGVDLRQENSGPVSTKARFSITNTHGNRLSGMERCISCWDQRLFSRYAAPNYFLPKNLQSTTGRALVSGVRSSHCPRARDAALLGLKTEMIRNEMGEVLSVTAERLVGREEWPAVIQYDVIPVDQRHRQAMSGQPPERRPGRPDAVFLNGADARDRTDGLDNAIALAGGCLPGAELVAMVSSTPPDGSIDARRPFDPVTGEAVGWDTIHWVVAEETCGLTPADFEVFTVPSRAVTPRVERVASSCTHVTLSLDSPIPPGVRTIIRHRASGIGSCLGFLPADANGDGFREPLDILTVVNHINGVLDAPLDLLHCDFDRSCFCDPIDIIRVVDLLNGVDGHISSLAETIPTCP